MRNYLLMCTLFIVLLSFSQDYIQIIKPDINIRMKPSTSSPIVGHAFNGEIYINNGEQDKWFSILLPSGETRWIYKTLAKKVGFNAQSLDEVNITQVQEDLKIAADDASRDANEEVINDLNKIQISNLLYDRYCLLTLQSYSILPVYYQYIIDYRHPSRTELKQPVAEHLMSVSHIDYDLFKVDGVNIYIETRRCFKLGSALDAMIFMYYEGDQFIQKLCFEEGYGKGFANCYNVQNIYKSVLDESNLVALTKDGKMKKTNLILKATKFELPD